MAARCKVWGLSAVSCVKIAKLIEMRCGMLSRVGPGYSVLDGDADFPTGKGTFGSVWPTEKHCKAYTIYYDLFPQIHVPLGVSLIMLHITGSNPPKKPYFGHIKAIFQAKMHVDSN